MNGMNTTELRILAPSIVDSGARSAVLTLRVTDILQASDLNTDKANTYAYLHITDRWPAEWDRRSFEGLTPKTWDRLHAGDISSTVALRGVPINSVENKAILKLRKGVRESNPADWSSPYDLMRSLKGKKLQRHIDEIASKIGSNDEHEVAAGERALKKLVAYLSDAGVSPVLVMSPVHPALREISAPLTPRLQSVLQRLAAEHHGLFLDATSLIDESEFADAIHPNENGRRAYSAFVGRAVATHIRSAGEN